MNRNILGMGLASFFSDMNHEMASAILPIFLSSVIGAPAAALGIIEGVADGVSTLFEIWSGWYSDRLGKRKGLAVIGYFITAFSKASFAWASTWTFVLLGRTLGWIGWSIRSPVRDALLVESTSPETIGRAFAFHRTMDTLGAILGPLIAVYLLTRLQIRWIFLVSLVPGLFAVLALYFIVKEKPKKPENSQFFESMKSLPKDFYRFLIPVGLFGISNFAPTLLILRAHELLAPSLGTLKSNLWATGLYTFGNFIYAIVAYPIGELADRVNKKNILGFGFLLFGFLCFGFAHAGSSLSFLILLFAVNGIYTAIIESSQPALASTLIPKNQNGSGFGLMSTVDGVGDFLSSLTIGLLWTNTSAALGFGVAGTIALIAAFWMFILKLPLLTKEKYEVI